MQRTPTCLTQDAALQPRMQHMQHMQLGLTHRALEPEQQAIVEIARIVDAVLVEDQSVGQGANLQQPVPVGGVARQPRNL